MVVVGIYFNSVYDEIFARASEDTELPDAENWVKVSDDARLGLVAIRTLLIEDGLTTDSPAVNWHGMNSRSGRSPLFASSRPDP